MANIDRVFTHIGLVLHIYSLLSMWTGWV